MVNCQAFGCNNDSRKGSGRNFYLIPNPERYPVKNRLDSSKVPQYIGTGWTLKIFKFTNHKRVYQVLCGKGNEGKRPVVKGL